MSIITKFMKDEDAFILEALVGLVGLLFLITAYGLFMPTTNILINAFVENGSPLAPNMWIRQMMIYAFLIFGVLCVLYPFASAYRKTYDQGQIQGGWR